MLALRQLASGFVSSVAESPSTMRPSFSPRRMTVDDATGKVRVDQSTVLLSPSREKQRNNGDGAAALLQGGLQAVLTGMIIAVVLTPVMIGFATMIYGHPEFEAAMPMLTKLVFVSSVAHQLAITILSPMPYAIAQTQDAGLIFLSSMAVSIMTELGPAVPMEERVATVVVCLSISAMLVGLGLIAIGKLRLASFVQFLPTPVIGGYLAYIGFFMVKGGLTLMTGATLTGLASWAQLADPHLLALLAPGLLCGLLLSLISSRYQHFAVFPCCLVAMPLVFFLALLLSGRSVDDARHYGFLSPETKTFSLVEVYALFDWRRIHWDAMFPQQLPTLVSMFLVIAFASSLDIASICMGTGATMDYNEQLQTVGQANLVSGLIGGYTGSYIFSQTVFSFRFHPAQLEASHPGFSRLVGLSLAACELAIALTPFSLTTVVPKFLFGSVMIFIGVELLKTWLVGVHSKLLLPEYATVLATFVFLNAFGVQAGLAAGVALAALLFLVEYSRNQAMRVVHKTSNVIRNAEQHELLHRVARQQPIVTVELQGHIFFGSATRLQNRVKKAVLVKQQHSPKGGERLPLLLDSETLVDLKGRRCGDRDRGRTRYVVFDFSHVTGLDATAARSCFLALKLLFRRHRVAVVYCGMDRSVEFLLRANDVIAIDDGGCHVTDDLDLALDWCEQQLLSVDQASLPRQAVELTVAQVLLAYVALDKRRKVERLLDKDVAPAFTLQRWQQHDQLFATGDAADEWFVLLRGQVTLFTTATTVDSSQDPVVSASAVSDSMTPRHFRRPQQQQHQQRGPFADEDDVETRSLVGRVRAGCLFGDMDFALAQPRSFDAVCSSDACVTASISRRALEALADAQPAGAALLQEIVLRAAYMTLAEKLHSIVV